MATKYICWLAQEKALRYFEPPTPDEIVQHLDCDSVFTVEGLRQLVLQELYDFQSFYEKNERLNEVKYT